MEAQRERMVGERGFEPPSHWPRKNRRQIWNHPRQSPTILLSCPYFPVFGSPMATVEVVRNTGNVSSEKAGVGGSTPSLATIFSTTYIRS